jgi:hypothetical protein
MDTIYDETLNIKPTCHTCRKKTIPYGDIYEKIVDFCFWFNYRFENKIISTAKSSYLECVISRLHFKT